MIDGSTPRSARVEGRSRYFPMFLEPGHDSTSGEQHNSLLHDRITEIIGVALTFLANVIWVQPCNHQSDIIDAFQISLGIPVVKNGSESSLSQKLRAAPQLNASYWLIHDSSVHFWHRGSYTHDQQVIPASTTTLTASFIRTHELYNL